MRLVTDLHVHSKYSRATSKQNNLEAFSAWVPKKGIDILGTADFTHPLWFNELKSKLVEIKDSGLYHLKDSDSPLQFMLTTEVSIIWSQAGRVRKCHLLILAPNLETVAKLGAMFGRVGNIYADGRPIFGMSARDCVAKVLEVNPDCLVIPAHAWTPWFSVFGSKSGFDSLDEAFGDMRSKITAIETGLSSDPAMNWRLSALDDVALVSFGDAHSMPNLMREATVFELSEPTYHEIIEGIKNSSPKALKSSYHVASSMYYGKENNINTHTTNYILPTTNSQIAYTIEFYPEEGKYHIDGHRECKISMEPAESIKHNDICPVCHKELTIGVLHRVEALADRPMGGQPKAVVPYKSLVQLDQIIGESMGVGEKSKKVIAEYDRLTEALESEFKILLDHPLDVIAKFADPKIVEGIKRVREGKISISPGFDGEYGRVRVFEDFFLNKQKTLF